MTDNVSQNLEKDYSIFLQSVLDDLQLWVQRQEYSLLKNIYYKLYWYRRIVKEEKSNLEWFVEQSSEVMSWVVKKTKNIISLMSKNRHNDLSYNINDYSQFNEVFHQWLVNEMSRAINYPNERITIIDNILSHLRLKIVILSLD
jgi:hypothetical protein